MNKQQEKKKLNELTNQNIELLNDVHELEVTLSRIKNEGEELLRKFMSAKKDG